MDPKRAKTARGRRALERMAPKLNENPKTTLLVRGQKTSATVSQALTDLYMLQKPNAKHFTRHNAVHPFEDATPLEFLCQKSDASLFAFGTHSKKRPNNLVLGRMFDFHVLDMVELGIDGYKPIAAFPEAGGGCASGTKPCLLFSGADWEHDVELQALRALLIDFFHLEVVEAISPLGIERVICFTACSGKVFLRHYIAQLRKSAEGTGPHVALVEMGPSMDLVLRRTQFAQSDLMKAAMTRPKAAAAAPRKVKNITRSKLMGKQGRLHMPRQDLGKVVTARMKALKKKRVGEDGEGAQGSDRPKKKAKAGAD